MIGDMPHTWVGSAFVDAVRALFVYENEDDSSLVIGAGIQEAWLNSKNGISIKNLPTFFGPISYSVKKIKNNVVIELNNKLDSECKEIILKSPIDKIIKSVLINGKVSKTLNGNQILLNRVDKKIVINYIDLKD